MFCISKVLWEGNPMWGRMFTSIPAPSRTITNVSQQWGEGNKVPLVENFRGKCLAKEVTLYDKANLGD